MCGRALLDIEDGETWITGVNPVGFAGGGMDRVEAFADFRQGWYENLLDTASESSSFEDFRARCDEFLGAERGDYTKDWQDALIAVRAEGKTDAELPSVKAEECPVFYHVVDLAAFESKAEVSGSTQEASLCAKVDPESGPEYRTAA